MARYRVYQIDSFTRTKFEGNPAGVVSNADGLSDAQMQQIARELNNSETAFIFNSAHPDYDVEVRFFTPTNEVPLCGHATIAAHYVLAKERAEGRCVHRLEASAKGRSTITRQKTKAGILAVETTAINNDWRIRMFQGEPHFEQPFAPEIRAEILAALGLAEQDLRSDCPVAIASAGHSKVFIGIASRATLDALTPDWERLKKVSALISCNGFYVYTLDEQAEILVHGRMFAPAIGILEDPVTGNANGPLGLYLVHHGLCAALHDEASFEFSILQGEAIGRPGTMRVHVDIEKGEPVAVNIVGEAVEVLRTEIELPSPNESFVKAKCYE